MQTTQTSNRNPEFTDRVVSGVHALRAGQRSAARRHFAAVLRADPGNATAWYWLSRAVDDEGQRRECLERLGALDRARSLASGSAPSVARRDDACAATAERSTVAAQALSLGSPRGQSRRRRLRRAFAVAALCAAIALLVAPLLNWRGTGTRAIAQTSRDPLQASGVVQAREVLLSSEYGGRVAALPVREGEQVRAGQVLVALDTALLDAQSEAAQAAVELGEAGLALARAGARPGQVAVAEAQLTQAQAARVAATQAVSDTAVVVENPQDIRLQISVARAQLQAADHRLANALALKDGAEIAKDKFYEAQSALRDAGGPGVRRVRAKVAQGSWDDIVARLPDEIRSRLPGAPADGVYTFGDTEIEVRGSIVTLYRWVTVDLYLPFEAHLAPNVWWQAWVGVNAAGAEKEGAQASLNLLYDQYNRPLELQAQADQAVAALAQTEAQVDAARAQVDALQAGATPEQIAILEAQVEQARAALETLLTQRAQMEIVAPSDGVVVDVPVHVGEVAARGATLVAVADLRTVQLTVYLPETQVGQVRVGESVRVVVDSFPGRTFPGTVVHIADSAEFTPRNIATEEERVNLVYAVEIELENDDGSLKPGMPADANFGP